MAPNRKELSFLSEIPYAVQPSVFDHDEYYPGKFFWKFTHIELYTIGDEQLAELRAAGWEPRDPATGVSLPLTSQLYLVLAIRKSGDERPELWMRTADRIQVEQCPVVLVAETKHNPSEEELFSLTPGTEALIYEGQAVYLYTLEHLPPEAKVLWESLHAFFHPKEPQFILSNRTPSGLIIPPEVIIRQYNEFMTSYFQKHDEARETARALAACYWKRHQAAPITPARLPKQLSEIPAFFRKTRLSAGSLLPTIEELEAVILALENAAEGADQWEEDTDRWPFFSYERGDTIAAVTVDVAQEDLPQDLDEQARLLWGRVRAFDDLDVDILLSLLAQWISAGSEERGGTWITAQDILDHRGITPKQHERAGGSEKRDAGHRPEDILEIARRVARLRGIHLAIESRSVPRKEGGRRRPVRREGHLIAISDYLSYRDPSEETKRITLSNAWYYQIGESLGMTPRTLRKRVAWLPQTALRYNPEKQKWEKRLARYLLFRLRGGDDLEGATLRQSIGTLLSETSLKINQGDPGKTKARFERAMQTLQKDGHCSDWGKERYEAVMRQLPTRHWVEKWLSYELEISASPHFEDLASELLEQVIEQPPQRIGLMPSQ